MRPRAFKPCCRPRCAAVSRWPTAAIGVSGLFFYPVWRARAKKSRAIASKTADICSLDSRMVTRLFRVVRLRECNPRIIRARVGLQCHRVTVRFEPKDVVHARVHVRF